MHPSLPVPARVFAALQACMVELLWHSTQAPLHA